MQNSLSLQVVSNGTNLLNDLYKKYVNGLLNKKGLEGAIFRTVQTDIHRFGMFGWSKEDYDDYISSLYPRISRAIDAYRESGSSFETYIGTLIRLTAKEYRARQVRTYMEETAAWLTQVPDMYACEPEVEYHEHGMAKTEEPPALKNPRQLLILILKCCTHVSIDFLEKVSPKLGVTPEELGTMIDKLKELREKRKQESVVLRERINRQFCRCILSEKKLKVLAAGSPAAQREKKQLEQGRAKLSRARLRLSRKRLDPSNAQIAKLLGISKGTVDTVLHSLKRRGLFVPEEK